MSHPQMESIVATLKAILRQRRVTYRALAEHLELSESGVKKLLNGEDISLGRVLQICEVVSVPLAEVVSAARRAPHEIVVDGERETFFIENVHHYGFLARLVELGYSRSALQADTGLSDASMDGYLRVLSGMGFFPLEGGARPLEVEAAFVRAARRRQGVSIRVGPRLGRRLRRELSHRLLETAEALRCEGSEDLDDETIRRVAEPFLQRKLTLTVDSVDALRKSLRALLASYADRSAIESATFPPEALLDIGWSYVIAPFDGRYPIREL